MTRPPTRCSCVAEAPARSRSSAPVVGTKAAVEGVSLRQRRRRRAPCPPTTDPSMCRALHAVGLTTAQPDGSLRSARNRRARGCGSRSRTCCWGPRWSNVGESDGYGHVQVTQRWVTVLEIVDVMHCTRSGGHGRTPVDVWISFIERQAIQHGASRSVPGTSGRPTSRDRTCARSRSTPSGSPSTVEAYWCGAERNPSFMEIFRTVSPSKEPDL